MEVEIKISSAYTRLLRKPRTDRQCVVILRNKLLFRKEKKLDGPESFRRGGVSRCAGFIIPF